MKYLSVGDIENGELSQLSCGYPQLTKSTNKLLIRKVIYQLRYIFTTIAGMAFSLLNVTGIALLCGLF